MSGKGRMRGQRGGLRDCDRHASWREVYSALGCPVPDSGGDERG